MSCFGSCGGVFLVESGISRRKLAADTMLLFYLIFFSLFKAYFEPMKGLKTSCVKAAETLHDRSFAKGPYLLGEGDARSTKLREHRDKGRSGGLHLEAVK